MKIMTLTPKKKYKYNYLFFIKYEKITYGNNVLYTCLLGLSLSIPNIIILLIKMMTKGKIVFFLFS